MAETPIPDIVEADYWEFHRICEGRIPDTHGAWSWEREKNKVAGWQYVPIRITPAELHR
jgi:hypothetical protein